MHPLELVRVFREDFNLMAREQIREHMAVRIHNVFLSKLDTSDYIHHNRSIPATR